MWMHSPIPVLALATLTAIATPASAGTSESRVELKQTGESARRNNPACATGAGMTAADFILKVGAVVVDRYIGQPVTMTILEQTSPGNREWLKGRLGIHDGRATCATLCVVVPNNVNPRLEACLSETGGDGLGCFNHTTENADPPAFAAIQSFTDGRTANAHVFCASGKNWSHNRDRWFIVRAVW
jgi:hypothetical protein